MSALGAHTMGSLHAPIRGPLLSGGRDKLETRRRQMMTMTSPPTRLNLSSWRLLMYCHCYYRRHLCSPAHGLAPSAGVNEFGPPPG